MQDIEAFTSEQSHQRDDCPQGRNRIHASCYRNCLHPMASGAQTWNKRAVGTYRRQIPPGSTHPVNQWQ